MTKGKSNHLIASSRNYFGGCALTRITERREDRAWLAERLGDPTTRIIVLHDSRHLFDQSNQPVFLSPQDFSSKPLDLRETVFLSEEEGIAYFALDLSTRSNDGANALHRLGEFKDVKLLAPFLPAQDAALLAYARALVHWHQTHRFCGACGAPAEPRSGGHMRQCLSTACGRQHFPRTDPAIIVLVTRGEYALLARSPHFRPKVLSTLAGFVEPGETLEAAVRREVFEETGVHVYHVEYHSSQPWPFPSSLMIGFYAKTDTIELRLNSSEIVEARWLTRAELQAAVASGELLLPSLASISYRLISEWLEAESE